MKFSLALSTLALALPLLVEARALDGAAGLESRAQAQQKGGANVSSFKVSFQLSFIKIK